MPFVRSVARRARRRLAMKTIVPCGKTVNAHVGDLFQWRHPNDSDGEFYDWGIFVDMVEYDYQNGIFVWSVYFARTGLDKVFLPKDDDMIHLVE